MFRPQSEAFIRRRSWYSVLPVLDTTERCRVKKAVVGMTELIVVHRSFVSTTGRTEYQLLLLMKASD